MIVTFLGHTHVPFGRDEMGIFRTNQYGLLYAYAILHSNKAVSFWLNLILWHSSHKHIPVCTYSN